MYFLNNAGFRGKGGFWGRERGFFSGTSFRSKERWIFGGEVFRGERHFFGGERWLFCGEEVFSGGQRCLVGGRCFGEGECGFFEEEGVVFLGRGCVCAPGQGRGLLT